MGKVVRFGISIEESLLKNFDRFIRSKGYKNRSQAIAQCLRAYLTQEQGLKATGVVTGVIILVYNHEKRELVNTLINLQHRFLGTVISTLHIHLSRHECLEVIVAKGEVKDLRTLTDNLTSIKGVKQSQFRIISPSD
ncbi:MAG: nickel-responsive transcriptional regulator NikR [Candidatus Desulfofervidaceae bacterium]|nr:nickel-responsive transcriptional regulator NikR [Candidatus Desulfofervidaceae bacterium]